MTITYYHDSFVTSFYERFDTSGAAESYTFDLPSKQDIYVSVDFYLGRMYPYGCDGSSSVYFSVSHNGKNLGNVQATTTLGFGYLSIPNADSGTYTVSVGQQSYGRDAVRDYTVGVYARDRVTVKNAQG